MGRKRKWKIEELEQYWIQYKQECAENSRIVSDFSSKSEKRVISRVPAPVPPTVTGFLIFIGMHRKSWYEVYSLKYPDFCERVRCECEELALKAFMTGEAPSALAQMVMRRYGWKMTDKDDTEDEGVTLTIDSAVSEYGK